MGVAALSNEHHDIAALRSQSGLSFDALHQGRRDEGEALAKDSLFAVVTNNAVAGRPSIIEIGYRVWIMALRFFVACPPMSAAMVREMQRIAVRCNGGLALPRASDAEAVFELLMLGTQTPWETGRRVTLLAYALNRGVVVREVLPSFESIGLLWQLRAENKRSAVCAAMNKLREEMMRTGKLPRGFRFWFEKSDEARAVYESVQLGNHNRTGGSKEAAETYEGVPIKQAFARLDERQRRRVLNELHEAAEAKRLGV